MNEVRLRVLTCISITIKILLITSCVQESPNSLILLQHFVADRKIDEELGKTTRFQYDSDHLREVSAC